MKLVNLESFVIFYKNNLYCLLFSVIVCVCYSCSVKNPFINNKINCEGNIKVVYKESNLSLQKEIINITRDPYRFCYYTSSVLNIMDEICNVKSNIYIDSLVYKFNEGFFLTRKEYAALNVLSIVNKIDNKKLEESINREDYAKVVQLASTMLDESPFSLHAMIAMYIGLKNTNTINSAFYINRFKTMCKAVHFSGDSSRDCPNIISDEYSLKYYIQYYALGAGYKLLEITKDKHGSKLYVYNNFMGKEYFLIP